MQNGFKQTLSMIDNVTKPMKDIQKQTDAARQSMDAIKQSTDSVSISMGGKMYSATKKTNLEIMQTYKNAGLTAKQLQKVADELGIVNPYVDELGNNARGASGGLKEMFGAFTLSNIAMKGLQMVTNGVKGLFDIARGQKKNKNLLQSMIGDPQVADAMFGHIKQMSADSVSGVGVGEMTKAYQTFMSTTKNVGQLDKLANVTERLALFDTTGQGFDGATFSMKELASGDYTSIAERFNISRSKIQEMGIHTLFKDGDIDGGIAQFEVLLDQMGYTQEAAENMATDPTVKWNQFTSNLETKFGTAMDSVMDKVGPLIDSFSKLTKTQMFDTMIQGIAGAIGVVITLFKNLSDGIMGVYEFFERNWSLIGPIMMIITATAIVPQMVALSSLIYQWIIYNGTMAIMKGMAIGAAIAMMIQEGATWSAAAAQYGLNAALWANPIVWVIGLIIGIIAALIYWSDGMGIVVGGLFVLGAYAINTFINIYNIVASFVEFFVNVWKHPEYAFKKLWYDLKSVAFDSLANVMEGVESFVGDGMKSANKFFNFFLGGFNKVTELSNKLLGTNLGAVDLLNVDNIHSASAAIRKMKGTAPDKPTGAWEAPKMEQIKYDDAYNKGFDIGKGGAEWIKDGIGGIFGGKNDALDEINNGIGALPENMPGSVGNPASVQEIDISEESIKLMRDVANMRFVQNFVTVTPDVKFGDVTVNENADAQKFASNLVDEIEEGLRISASGVYG